jgi:two-component system alkaline phosphatase synthesis response regulator PhoP
MPLKILVVEDNTDTRLALHHYFKNAGYEIHTAVDGEEGLYMAKSELPDLIITDIAMPKLDGMDYDKENPFRTRNRQNSHPNLYRSRQL